MTEQELILNKFTTNGVIDNMTNQLKMIRDMVNNAKTEEDLMKAKNYFEYTIDNCKQQLIDKNAKTR